MDNMQNILLNIVHGINGFFEYIHGGGITCPGDSLLRIIFNKIGEIDSEPFPQFGKNLIFE